MEEEAAKLREMQAQVEKEMSSSGLDLAQSADADARSVYVGNVDYSSTPEELQQHFQSCGTIHRITIVCDKFTGQPKGFAYVEFAAPEHVANATALNESLFRNRQLKVLPKRTNIPGFNAAQGRGRGRGRGGFRGAPMRGVRGGRSRRGHYAPY
jgi:polyadenylate-binding protein 2